jgi:hypothetical protein
MALVTLRALWVHAVSMLFWMREGFCVERDEAYASRDDDSRAEERAAVPARRGAP